MSYHQYTNQPIHNGYPQFFGIPTVTVSAASAQESQKSTPSQGLFDDSSGDKSENDKAKSETSSGGAGARKKADTSGFTIEERLVAAAWVHERYHTHTSMGKIIIPSTDISTITRELRHARQLSLSNSSEGLPGTVNDNSVSFALLQNIIKHQFELRFGRPAPAKNTLVAWERKLFATGTVHDAPRAGRPAKRKLQAGEVSESLAAAPELSVRARAAALAVPRTTLRALLRHLPAPARASADTAKPKAGRRRGAGGKAAPPAPAPPAPPAPPAAADYYEHVAGYRRPHGDVTR